MQGEKCQEKSEKKLNPRIFSRSGGPVVKGKLKGKETVLTGKRDAP
jgi:hypothetical protein